MSCCYQKVLTNEVDIPWQSSLRMQSGNKTDALIGEDWPGTKQSLFTWTRQSRDGSNFSANTRLSAVTKHANRAHSSICHFSWPALAQKQFAEMKLVNKCSFDLLSFKEWGEALLCGTTKIGELRGLQTPVSFNSQQALYATQPVHLPCHALVRNKSNCLFHFFLFH